MRPRAWGHFLNAHYLAEHRTRAKVRYDRGGKGGVRRMIAQCRAIPITLRNCSTTIQRRNLDVLTFGSGTLLNTTSQRSSDLSSHAERDVYAQQLANCPITRKPAGFESRTLQSAQLRRNAASIPIHAPLITCWRSPTQTMGARVHRFGRSQHSPPMTIFRTVQDLCKSRRCTPCHAIGRRGHRHGFIARCG